MAQNILVILVKDYYKVNKTKGTLVHDRGERLLDGVEAIT